MRCFTIRGGPGHGAYKVTKQEFDGLDVMVAQVMIKRGRGGRIIDMYTVYDLGYSCITVTGDREQKSTLASFVDASKAPIQYCSACLHRRNDTIAGASR